jgi:hypothetical protein
LILFESSVIEAAIRESLTARRLPAAMLWLWIVPFVEKVISRDETVFATELDVTSLVNVSV